MPLLHLQVITRLQFQVQCKVKIVCWYLFLQIQCHFSCFVLTSFLNAAKGSDLNGELCLFPPWGFSNHRKPFLELPHCVHNYPGNDYPKIVSWLGCLLPFFIIDAYCPKYLTHALKYVCSIKIGYLKDTKHGMDEVIVLKLFEDNSTFSVMCNSVCTYVFQI